MASHEPRSDPNLRYVGPRPRDVGFVLPLEEGWSAVDHYEGDAAVFARKVSTGHYVPVEGEREKGRRGERPTPAPVNKEVSGGDSTAEL